MVFVPDLKLNKFSELDNSFWAENACWFFGFDYLKSNFILPLSGRNGKWFGGN